MGDKDHLPTPEETLKKQRRDLKKVTSTAYIGNPPNLTRGIDAIGLLARTTGEVRDTEFPILFDIDDQTNAPVPTSVYNLDLSKPTAHFHRLLLDDNGGLIPDFTINLNNLAKNKELEFILDIVTNFTGNPTVTFEPPIDNLPAGFPLLNPSYLMLVSAVDSPTILQYKVVSGGGGGITEESTFISADLVADQTANLAVGDHIEFDRNIPPTGADGGIVLQTGAGQANGIFELKQDTTYFMSASVSPIKSAATQLVMAWYDITNGNELGRRAVYDIGNVLNLDNQPNCQVVYTPTTDVTVELRIIALSTPANLTGFFAITTFANIFTFQLGIGGGGTGTSGITNWKLPARVKSTADIASLAAMPEVQDGVTLVQGNRILLTEQSDKSENGIYDVGVITANVAPITRSSDFDSNEEALSESFVPIEEGTVHKNQVWHLTTNNIINVGVTNQTWEEFATPPSLGPAGADGEDAAGTFILDGRTGIGAANMDKVELFWPIKAPRVYQGDMILIEQEQYDHGDFSPSVGDEASNPNPVLVIVGHSGVPGGALYPTSSRSTNYGESWALLTELSSDTNWRNLAYDPTAKVLICSSGSLQGRSLQKGTEWAVTTESWSAQDCIWVERLSLFVLLDTGTGTNVIWTSPDAVSGNWTQQTTPAADVIPPTLFTGFDSIRDAPGLGKIYVFGNICSNCITSTDGITWVSENLLSVEDGHAGGIGWSFQDPPRVLTWNDGARRFIAYDSSIVKDLATEGYWLSAVGDPLTWTHHFIPTAGQAGTMVVQESAAMWIVACQSNNEKKQPFHVSFDGLNWTAVPTGVLRRQDYDPNQLASDSLKQPKFPVVSKNFGYVMCNGWNTRTTDNLYIWNMFYRTEVYFNSLLTEASFRDEFNPR